MEIIMGIVIDIIIAAICIGIVFKSYRDGFVKSVMGLAKGIVSLVAAYAFTPALANYIYEKFALNGISEGIEKSLSSLSQTAAGTFDLEKMFADMPDALSQIITRYGTDRDALGEMCSGLSAGSADSVSSVADYIADPVAHGLSTAVAFIILFVVISLVLSVVIFVVDAIFHLPVLHGANKLLGLVFGVAEGILFCVILGYGAAMLVGYLGSFDPEMFGDHVVEGSIIMKTMSSVDLLGIAEGLVK